MKKKKIPPKKVFFQPLFYPTFQWRRYSEKVKKQASKVAHNQPNPFFHSPAQTTAQSPELIFHIMKSRDQTSVLLSVPETHIKQAKRHF
jgi:hypothetical protein